MRNPWETSVYIAMCKTSRVAHELAKNHANVCTMEALHRPPFCLRILKPYRTPAMQAFRDKVAAIAWERRHTLTYS